MHLYSDIKYTPAFMVRHYVQKHYGFTVISYEKEPELGHITFCNFETFVSPTSACTYIQTLSAPSIISACTFMQGDTVHVTEPWL